MTNNGQDWMNITRQHKSIYGRIRIVNAVAGAKPVRYITYGAGVRKSQTANTSWPPAGLVIDEYMTTLHKPERKDG